MRYIIKYKEIKYNIISQKLGNIDGLIEDFFQAPDLLPLMVQVLRLIAAVAAVAAVAAYNAAVAAYIAAVAACRR